MGCCGSSPKIKHQTVPSLNVASALEKARSQFKATDTVERIEKRIQLCKACPYFQKEMCHRCGCYLVNKVAILTESCPIRRW